MRDVRLAVGDGECVGHVGLRGPGAATAAAAAVGPLRPAAGAITLDGRPISPGRVHAK